MPKIKLTQIGPVKKEDMVINKFEGIVKRLGGLKRNINIKPKKPK